MSQLIHGTDVNGTHHVKYGQRGDWHHAWSPAGVFLRALDFFGML